MKIAGRKNDGAWFRTNKALAAVDAPDQTQLAALLAADTNVIGLWNGIVALATKTGIATGTGTTGYPATIAAWCALLSQGEIPRQVWFGVMTFDTYTKDGTTGKYKPDTQEAARKGGESIRKITTRFIFALRQLRDQLDATPAHQNNPGGIPSLP